MGDRLEEIGTWLFTGVIAVVGFLWWGGICAIVVIAALDIFGVIEIDTDEPKPARAPIERSAGPTCDPNYTGCVPDTFYDVDCDEVAGPVHVIGFDTNGLDADNDGIACEWG